MDSFRRNFLRRLSMVVGAVFVFLCSFAARAEKKADPKAECVRAYKEGQVHRKNTELMSARDDFAICADKVCPQVLRSDCAPWLAKMEESIPTIVVHATSSTGKPLMEVRISLDGKVSEKLGLNQEIETDPGAHVVRVEAKDHEPIEKSVKVRIGEKNTAVNIELSLPVSAQKTMVRPIPASAIAFSVVGLAGIGAFAGFGLYGNSLKKDLEICKPACAPDRVDAVKRDYIIADAALGVGIVFLGLATWSFLTRPEVPRQTTAWTFSVTPGRAMFGFGGVF